MASYESDSSDDDAGSFITTNVLLGYASKEATDDEISQLGGTPSWISDTPPHGSQTACFVCNERMPLILQLHADLPERFPGHDRRLHVFGCRRKACRRKNGSVRALRSTRVDPSAASTATATESSNSKASGSENGGGRSSGSVATGNTGDQSQSQAAAAPQSFLGSSIFGGAKPPSAKNPFAAGGAASASGGGVPQSPFSLSSVGELASKSPQNPTKTTTTTTTTTTEASVSNLPTTFAEKAKIAVSPSPSSSSSQSTQKQSQPRKEPGPQQPAYPSYFLDADYEALGEGPPAPEQDARVIEVDEDGSGGTAAGSSSSAAAGDGSDAFESQHDKAFQRFADRLWHNPEQVLRYEVGGTPLLYSRTDAVGSALAPADHSHQQQNAKVKTAAKGSPVMTTPGIPACASCGAQRAFECQITPHAIVELEAEDESAVDDNDGMEWGTIIVGVCTRDCEERGVEKGKVGYVDEWAGVQWEESKK